MTLQSMTIKNVCAYFYLASTLFLFALLPMAFHDIYRSALSLFFISFILDYVVNKRWQNFRFTRSSIVYICLILYYLLLFIYWPLENDPIYLGTIAEYSMSFVAFSLIGLAGGFNDKFKIKYFALVGAIFPIIYALHTITVHVGWETFINQDMKTNFPIFNTFMNKKINAHMGFNFFCNVEILLTYYLFKTRHEAKTTFDKTIMWFCFTCSIILVLLILISQGRVGLLCLIIIVFYILVDLTKKYKYYMLATSSAFLIAAILYTATRPRFDRTQIAKTEPRNIVWDVSVKNIKESPLVGYGASTTYTIMQKDLLNAEWPENSNLFLVEQIENGIWWGGHPHNQLMQSCLNYGITGVLIMLAIFILPFFALKKDEFYPLFGLLWLCILIQLQTEVIQTSISFIGFSFFLLFILSFQGDTRPILKQKDA